MLGRRSPRTRLRRRLTKIHRRVASAHYESELELIVDAILDRAGVPGDVVEFGCFKGGSTAKLSLACDVAGKRLRVFDSFEGLPEPAEWDAEHQIERVRTFRRGEYSGTLDEVRRNVRRYGRIQTCVFERGWFRDTLQRLTGPVAVAFVDVDLAQSTREVLAHVWPLLSPGGIVFLHDATDEKLQKVFVDLTAGASELHVPARDELAQLESKTLAWAKR